MDFEKMSADDLVLACLQAGNESAWSEFIRRFHRLITTAVMRTASKWGRPSPQLIDDLIQETYLKLCEKDCRLLRDFRSRHPDAIFGFLKVVAINTVLDHFKSSNAQKRGAGKVEVSIESSSISQKHSISAPHPEMYQILLFEDIARCLRTCASGHDHDRNQTIFWLYYRQGLTAKAIAAIPSIGLNTKGVETTILRMTRLVRSQLGLRNPVDMSGRKKTLDSGEDILPSESF